MIAALERIARAGLVALALATSAVGPSCGYSAGLAPARPGGAETRSIGAEIFGNQTLLPNLERGLHEALSTAARRHANMTLVSPERADVVIRGDVVDFRRQQGARTTGNRFVEARDVVTVDATLVDRASGEVVARTRTEVGFGTAIDVAGREPAARDNVLRNSADRILLTLLAELQYGRTAPPLPEDPPADG